MHKCTYFIAAMHWTRTILITFFVFFPLIFIHNHFFFFFLIIFQCRQRHCNNRKMLVTNWICHYKQYLLYSNICCLDDDTISNEILSATSLLEIGRSFFPLALGNGLHVVMVRRIWQWVWENNWQLFFFLFSFMLYYFLRFFFQF